MRGIDVLMAINMAPEPPRFADIKAAVGLPNGTLHRLLAALIRRQLIRYDSHNKRYLTGSRVFDLARRTLDQSQVLRAARPELARLARLLGRPVCLCLADAGEIFVIDYEDPDATQSRVVRLWPRLAASDCAAGLAMLANLPADQRPALPTGGADLGLFRALGYATHLAARGGASAAAAICDDKGIPLAAISVAFDGSAAAPETLHEAGRLLAEAAHRAEANFGVSVATPAIVTEAPGPVPDSLTDHATGRDFMGENPVWSARDGRLYWLDILAPALRSLAPQSGHNTHRILPRVIGGLALAMDGRMIHLGQGGIFTHDPASGSQNLLLDPEPELPDNRFNTAAVDPGGCLWAGTMSLRNRPGTGALYRITPELGVRRVIGPVGLPKNCAFSPDGRQLYYTDGARKAILRHDLDIKSGSIGPEQILFSATSDSGLPNGIACDSEGMIWVAMLGGWSVWRLDPQGRVERRVALPVPMPTAVTLGGADMRRLFITSTYLRLPPGYSTIAPRSGNLFSIPVDIPGQPVRIFGGKA
ncbi:SMP-30/gluconolactonase/LRE family protein [Paracoccus lutimaris]|uniref:IclR family transcriptional regulator n=1 Tax=Paracoccus lutimaris TaxID=1490030 RepID=A0A368Z4U8_9RHOB|nr:SMP-30/gluconolactonase/LRE family protein [Paracoccus lutimaris]RCW86798.1 IclR family transcriptional regulator [Paracoccus lutimaris]